MHTIAISEEEERFKFKYEIYPTFKEAPSTKEQEGQEEVGGEVVQGGHHDTRGAWIGLKGSVVTCAVGGCEVEAGAAVGDRGGVVEVGESQGAGDRFRREEREEPDQDEAGEQGEGGGQHRRFKLRPTKLGARFIDRGSEEGENK